MADHLPAGDVAREHAATLLQPLFRPQAVAVIGASPRPGSIGMNVLTRLLGGNFQGPVYPVHPAARAVASVRAFPSIGDIPDDVDLAVVAVPATTVIGVAEECARKGVRALVVLSAGFAEIGNEGRALQDRLLRIVRDNGMRMVGPNCLGVVNTDPDVRLNAIFGRPLARRGNVALSSQSGAMGLAIMDYADELGLGLSYFVSVGNKADVSGNDLLEYWEHDSSTSVIALYLESFGNPRRFTRIARRVGRRKPILAVKSGRGQAGSRAARSHTAALAGSEVAVDALFHQAGVIRLDTLEEMFEVAALLANQPLPAGNRVAVITNAGGPGILCADACEANGLELPALADDTRDALRALLPAAAGLGNPIDMIASASPDHYEAVARQVLLDPGIDAVIAINIAIGGPDPDVFAASLRAGVEAAAMHGACKPVLACFMSSDRTPAPLQAAAGEPGHGVGTIPCYRFPESPARALGRAARYREWRNRPEGEFAQLTGTDAAAASAVVDAAVARGADWLRPEESSRLMAAAGIRIARQRVVPDEDSAAAAAEAIGWPVVVKLISRDVLHKSDVGGVALGLVNAGQLREACEGMRVRAEGIGARVEGFLVQEQARPGHEVLVGVAADPVFGPLIGFGLGGTTAEVLRDTAFRIAPLTTGDAAEMVRSIRGHALLDGYRGQPPADIPAVDDLLLRVAWLADTVPIAEMDLNPVVVYERGAGLLVLDVRVAVRAG